MTRILGIGNALVDILTIVEQEELLVELNLPKGSMQLVDADTSIKVALFTQHLKKSKASGGSAANTIHGLARLGVNTSFIGHVGEDETGDFFYKDMLLANIQPVLFRSSTPSGIANAMITNDSERTFATYLGAAIELSELHLSPSLFDGFTMLYVEGYLVQNEALLLKAMRLAKDAGLKIVLDLASYNVVEANRAILNLVLEQYVDIVFANEEEAKALTAKEPEEALRTLASVCEIAIVKIGAKGSLIKKGDQEVHINAIPANPVDTTGAGDLFASGFIYGLVSGFDLEKSGRIGSLLAGKVIEVIGPKMDAQRWKMIFEEIEKL